MRASSFKYLVGQGVRSVWVNRLMSFASFCVMLVSLLMIGLSVLASENINKIIGAIEDKNEIVVQIYDNTPQFAIDNLGEDLNAVANIASVTFYSKDQALEDVKASMAEDQQSLFDLFDSNPLPDTYRVKVKDITKMSQTVSMISTMSFVENIKEPSDFASLLTSIRNVVTVISIAIVCALFVVCMVIISNATRTSVFTRRKEINIMKYVGATNTFIKIPFFVEGLIVGLIAAVGATVFTKFAYDAVFGIFSENFQMWSILGVSSLIPFETIFIKTALCYLLAGALIGGVGTAISTSKHLKV